MCDFIISCFLLSVIWFYITSPDLLIIFLYSIMNPRRTRQQWCRYGLLLKPSNIQRKGRNRVTVFCLPFLVDNGRDAVIDEDVRTHLLCSRGLRVLLNFGRRRYLKIRNAAKSSAVLPNHKSTGKTNYQAVKKMSVSIGLSRIILSTSRILVRSERRKLSWRWSMGWVATQIVTTTLT